MSYVLLDLFCGAGGAAMGYHQAGFNIVGVDNKPQPRFPFAFIQADAIEFCAQYGHLFHAIHASPPCQSFSTLTSLTSTKKHLNLISPMRDALKQTKVPYVIENVTTAPLLNPIILCGTSFGLETIRHRLFESNILLCAPPKCKHDNLTLYSILTKSCRRAGDLRGPSSHAVGKRVMQIDWMTQDEISQAIPPAYTQYIGNYYFKLILDGILI